MAESISTYNILLRSAADKQSSGQVQIQILSQSQRFVKAIVTGFFAFACTLVTILIPVFHFFLFPLGLILTVVLAIKSYGKSSIIIGGSGPCPECSKEVKIFKRANIFPFQDVCEHCRRQITITTASMK